MTRDGIPIARVEEFLNSEGYPLEYYTANKFMRSHFQVTQGDFTHDGSQNPREIDVLATMTWPAGADDGFIRLYNIVECKWTKANPWIVLTSPTTRKSSPAIIAQAFASQGGQTAMWANCHNPCLAELELFQSPEFGGFGGRQAFSKGQDKFYDSLRSVVSNCISVTEFDNAHVESEFPDIFSVAFPVVVIDGELFEAKYDEKDDKLVSEKTHHSRCHWRGNGGSPFSSTIDIVTKEGLDSFCKQRSLEFSILASALIRSYGQLKHCYDDKTTRHMEFHAEETDLTSGPGIWPLIQNRSRNR